MEMTMALSVLTERFAHVYVVDTEYVAKPGERNHPVCLVARSVSDDADIGLFFDEQHPTPFQSPEETLLIGYNLSSELQTMLALGWQLPAHCLDLYVEFLNLVNGVWLGNTKLRELGTGLQDAVTSFGGSPTDFWRGIKDDERDYVLTHVTSAPEGVTQADHQKRILSYCREDVDATYWLAEQMLGEFDLDQALWRAQYAKADAWFQFNGLPIDLEKFRMIESSAEALKLDIAKQTEEKYGFGVYVVKGTIDGKTKPHPVFSNQNFLQLLEAMNIRKGWKTTPSGAPALDDDYFSAMCRVYPSFEPLRQCRKSINNLGRFGSSIGADGANRAHLWMYGTATGRNNPKARDFLLSRPHWLRNLIKPKDGMALIACDVTGAEDWLAAGFSGDPELMRIYSSGTDSYMEFAAVTGAVPIGTRRNKADPLLENVRSMHKTAKLAIQYGVGSNTLADYLGVPTWKAGQIITAHKRAYAVYWQWAEEQAELATARGYVETDFGWRQSTDRMSQLSILNFPQQAACAELLRCACNLLVSAGWGYALAAPHHDAVYMHCQSNRAEECKFAVENAFLQAGELVMGLPDFPLRLHSEITYAPSNYYDVDGKDVWEIVCNYFGWPTKGL